MSRSSYSTALGIKRGLWFDFSSTRGDRGSIEVRALRSNLYARHASALVSKLKDTCLYIRSDYFQQRYPWHLLVLITLVFPPASKSPARISLPMGNTLLPPLKL